jgi:peptidoglycan/xylan/chitin deacetylase (PgdA/CDA1 family)
MKRIAVSLAIVAVLVATAVAAAAYIPSSTEAPYVYLTFDDGPTPGYTNEVLADLNAAGARATFFQVGEHMAGNEALMRQLVADGNQLGTHSWDHPDFGNIAGNGAAVWEEIQRPRSIQVNATGRDSGLFRYLISKPSITVIKS